MTRVKLSSGDRVLFPRTGSRRATSSTTTRRSPGDPAAPARPAVHDEAMARGPARRQLLPEAGAEGHAGLDPDPRVPTWPREGELAARRLPARQLADALLWMVQMHCIDMNAWYSRVDKPDRPDFVLFDLDPPEEPTASRSRRGRAPDPRGARGPRPRARTSKTSGADGIHVLVPIARRPGYSETYEFAELLSRAPRGRASGEVTTEWLKKKRTGVLVDHRQNG